MRTDARCEHGTAKPLADCPPGTALSCPTCRKRLTVFCCPHCQARLRTDGLPGAEILCPKCHARCTVPAAVGASGIKREAPHASSPPPAAAASSGAVSKKAAASARREV